MTKSLKVHPNERVDLGDFEQGTVVYPRDNTKLNTEKTVIDHRSRVLEGFRVQIDDQAAFPGQITVFNGTAVDRDGALVHEEDLPATQLTVTLSGSSTTFYVEVERLETPSDVDSRGFWDPSFDNGASEDGREFPLSVATRTAPTWRIVRPVSTTGFQATSNPSSTRIPLAILVTDGANEITGAVNTGLATVQPSTVTDGDVSIGQTRIPVVSARLFNATDNITVDLGGAAPEAVVVSSVDGDNNILTVAPALLSAHQAGAIVRRTSGTARLMQERTLPSDTAHPERTPKMFQGDEIRGSGLMKSKETFGDRDDLSLKTLKDYTDFLAAQIRDMRFGSPRSDESTANTPPASFSTHPRYLDPSGSITGARSNTVSIGDGVNSFGDFNGTDETPFIAAVAALAATSPASGTILVKNGTYTLTNTVALDRAMTVQGMGRSSTIIVSNVVGAPAFEVGAGASTDVVAMRDLTVQQGTGDIEIIDLTGLGRLHLQQCAFSGTFVRSGLVDNRVHAVDCRFSAGSGVAVFGNAGGTSVFANCIVQRCSGTVGFLFHGQVNQVVVADCAMTCTSLFYIAGAVASANIEVRGNNLAIGSVLFYVDADLDFLSVHENRITAATTGGSPVLIYTPSFVAFTNHSWAYNRVTAVVAGSTEASPSYIFYYNSDISDLHVHGNNFEVTGGSYVTFAGFANGLVDSCVITENRFQECYRFWHMLSGANTDTLISGNIIASAALAVVGATPTHALVQFDAAVTGSDVRIRNNQLSIPSSTGDKYGVLINSTSPVDLEISGNEFDVTSSDRIAYGVSVTGPHVFEITGNKVTSDGATGGAYGISCVLNSGVGHGTISGNVIREYSSTASAADTVGIRVDGGSGVTVTGNSVQGGVGTTSFVGGIVVRGTPNATISGNSVEPITTSNSLSAAAAGIKSINPVRHSITGNSVRCGDTTANGILVTTEVGGNVSSGSIGSNSVLMAGETYGGIVMTALSGSPFEGFSVTGNTVTMGGATVRARGFQIVTSGAGNKGLTFSGNTVLEDTFAADATAFSFISATGDAFGVCINGNTFMGDQPNATARTESAVVCTGLDSFSFSGNVVYWDHVSSGVSVEDTVLFTNVVRGVVNSNRVNPNDATDAISFVASTYTLVNGNYTGFNGVEVGAINTGGGAGITSTNNVTT